MCKLLNWRPRLHLGVNKINKRDEKGFSKDEKVAECSGLSLFEFFLKT